MASKHRVIDFCVGEADCDFGLALLGIRHSLRVGQIDLESATQPVTCLSFRHVPSDALLLALGSRLNIEHRDQ
jgi:hypothetical protein